MLNSFPSTKGTEIQLNKSTCTMFPGIIALKIALKENKGTATEAVAIVQTILYLFSAL